MIQMFDSIGNYQLNFTWYFSNLKKTIDCSVSLEDAAYCAHPDPRIMLPPYFGAVAHEHLLAALDVSRRDRHHVKATQVRMHRVGTLLHNGCVCVCVGGGGGGGGV